MMTLSQQQQRAHDTLSAATVTTTTTRVAEDTATVRTTTTVDVVDAEYHVCYQFHIRDIQHMPKSSKRWNTDLVLCQRYQGHHHHGSAASSSSCEKGSDCWFIHADVSKAVNQWQVHVNYAWRDESEVTYERLPEGSQLLCVSAPNQRMPYEMCRRDLFLVTEGVTRRCCIPTTTTTCGRKQGKVEVGGDERSYVEEEEGLLVRNDHQGAVRRGEQRGGTTTGMTATVTHCAHFYFNRVCHKGSQCTYAHRITIDPTAMPGQRAPAPSVIPGTRAIISKLLLNNDNNNNYTTTTGQMNNAKIKMSRKKKYELCDSSSTHQVNSNMCSSSRSCSTPHTAVDASSFNGGTWLLLQQHNKSSSVKITATTAERTTTTAATISGGGSGTSSSMDDDTLRGDDSVESMTSVTDDGCCSFGSREDDADSFRVVPLEMTRTKTSSASLFATTGGGKLLLGTDGARFRHNPYLA